MIYLLVIHHSVKQFVRDIIPDKYANIKSDTDGKPLVTDRGRILLDEEFMTPKKILLENEFFNKMRPESHKIIK